MEIIQFYPFLNSIYASIKYQVDWEELCIPNSYEILLMSELTQRLNKHIILYKKDYHSKSNIPLSTTLVPTKLSFWQVAILKNYREKFSDYCKIETYNDPLKLVEFVSSQTKNKKYVNLFH